MFFTRDFFPPKSYAPSPAGLPPRSTRHALCPEYIVRCRFFAGFSQVFVPLSVGFCRQSPAIAGFCMKSCSKSFGAFMGFVGNVRNPSEPTKPFKSLRGFRQDSSEKPAKPAFYLQKPAKIYQKSTENP